MGFSFEGVLHVSERFWYSRRMHGNMEALGATDLDAVNAVNN